MDGWMDGATARFVTFGFGRAKRANDDDDDGDDGDDDDARRASFHSSVHRIIDSIHSLVRSRSVCFLRSRARRVDSLATTTTTTTGGGGSRRRSGASVRDACTHVARPRGVGAAVTDSTATDSIRRLERRRHDARPSR